MEKEIKKHKIEMELIVDEETGKELNSPVVFKIPVYTTDDFGNEQVSFKKEMISRDELLKKIDSLNFSTQAHQASIEQNQKELDEIDEKLALIPE